MLALLVVLLLAQCALGQFTLTADPPAGPEAVSISYTGTPGVHTSAYYWVVANFPRGQAAARGPVQYQGTPATLDGSNYLTIAWKQPTGALTYDVLKTTTPVAPNSCTCLLGNTAGASLNDTGGSLSAYTLTPVSKASVQIWLDNLNFATPTIILDGGIRVTGNLLCATDGGCNIGASGANRPYQLYVQDSARVGAFEVDSTRYMAWNARSVMRSPADGSITLLNLAENGFSLLQFGGTTNAFPALKRNGAGIDFRVASDDAYAAITGVLEIKWQPGTEGTCDVNNRFRTVAIAGGAGTADTFRVCSKDAADAYAWRALYQ